jgi:SAM-dependent methyltransferase
MTAESTRLVRDEYRNPAPLDARIALHQNYSRNPQNFYAWVFDRLQIPPTGRVLDIGCGSGRLWSENHARVPSDWIIILADLSVTMVQTSAAQLPAQASFRFLAADIQTLPFADASFDAVVATHMLYHIPDRPQAYAEICRVLCPAGRFYTSTNSRTTMQRYDQLVSAAREEPLREPPGVNDSSRQQGFNLEHGGDDLGQAFSHVILHQYKDSLQLTTAEPLVAYAAASGHLAREALKRFRDLVEAAIGAEGRLEIDKSAGLFEAVL